MRRAAARRIALAVLSIATLPATAALADDDPPIAVVPGDQYGRLGHPKVDVRVRDEATGVQADTARPPADAGGRRQACRWQLAPEMEVWIRRLPAALPRRGDDNIDQRARLYQRRCGGLDAGYAWFGPGQPGAVAVPDPAELAREAYAQLRLPAPVPTSSPNLWLADGRRAVLVGEQTWVWTAGGYAARSRVVRAGAVWARVTATPVGLSFDPGDGTPLVSCRGPGTAFVVGRDRPHAVSPSCGHLYRRSSAGRPGGVVTAVYGIRWQVRWIGSTGAAAAGGALPDMTSRAAAVFAVAEAQALGTASR